MADLAFDRYVAPQPTAYHRSLADHLERRDADLWRWFASDSVSEEAADMLRLELLKRTYRLDREAHAGLYEAADQIAAALAKRAGGAAVPVTLYQAEGAGGRNAALYFEPDVAHVVFEGDALQALDAAELRYTLGHELAHHELWRADSERYWTAHRLLRWASAQPGAAAAFVETARLERLYTEIFADRFGLWAVGDLEPSISAHVKLAHGGAEASGAAYLAQAEEALARAGAAARSEARSHPESYIRAALMAAWAHDPAAAEARARSLIEGSAPLEALDLLAQERVADITFWMVAEFLTEPWASRPLIRAHARNLSDSLADALGGPSRDGGPADASDLDGLRSRIAAAHPTVRAYLVYLLLDFATVDDQLQDVMLAAALRFSEDFGLSDDLKAAAAAELKTTKTKLAELEKNAVRILSKAELSLCALDDNASGASDARAAERRLAGGAA